MRCTFYDTVSLYHLSFCFHGRFTFDSVYDSTSTQREIYDRTAAPIVDCVMEGYNGTIFAYGQVGLYK